MFYGCDTLFYKIDSIFFCFYVYVFTKHFFIILIILSFNK